MKKISTVRVMALEPPRGNRIKLADLSRGIPQCPYLFRPTSPGEGRRACVRVAKHSGKHLDYVQAYKVTP